MSIQNQPNQGNQGSQNNQASGNRGSATMPAEKQDEKAGMSGKGGEVPSGARTDVKPNGGSRERSEDDKQSTSATDADKHRTGQSGAQAGRPSSQSDEDKNAQGRSKST